MHSFALSNLGADPKENEVIVRTAFLKYKHPKPFKGEKSEN